MWTKNMGARKSRPWRFVSIFLLAAAVGGWIAPAAAQETATSDAAAEDAAEKPDNEMCLDCHGIEDFSVPIEGDDEDAVRKLHIDSERFGLSVHGVRFCVECHKDIVEIPHQPNIDRKVGCVQCHRQLWEDVQREGKTEEFATLGKVVEQIKSYMDSIHAHASMEDQSRTNATCYDCHNAHYVFPIAGEVGALSRLEIPDICGRCHVEERKAYLTSVHGDEVSKNMNAFAAVCIDCHTTHTIQSPQADSNRLVITQNCGNCHDEEFETYTGTYHGQVTTLGFAYTAKCFDCHGSHEIKRTDDEASMVHVNNRLETCQKCHVGATAGFVTFEPHGHSGDFDRYPYMWITGKFMIVLLASVFAFFWTHLALWFYREYKDRKEGKTIPHIQMDELPETEGKFVKRWSPVWRTAHLLLAISVMVLVLTGTAVLYAECGWAQFIMKVLGGPTSAAILHRIAAFTFIVLFFGHLGWFSIYYVRNWRTWRIFGPNSMVPNWQDLKDVVAMFQWFFGRRPRPVFDRWSYWEKFDYWAPFWGMAIIGISGAMMWFPEITASIFPGWIFNVATIIHGEEAFLAAVFLFSVHFSNVHFRPDKFPMDIVMFTGVMPLEEYKREHTVEYKRLIESGELGKYIVDAPSQPMTFWSKFLGATLILTGLTLLVLVLHGFFVQTVLV
jgi:cytochrome b subunit of formate dehydrogenase